MQIFKKAAASVSAVGLLALGAVAVSGGSALASTQQSITACSALEGAVAVGVIPNCTAGNSTIKNPTSITITLNTSALSSLLNVVPGLGLQASWTLSCVVDGASVSKSSSYTVSSVTQSASTSIDLQAAVGSPEPNTCTISGLKVQTTLAVSVGLPGVSPFTLGVSATGTTAVPGAIYQSEGTTSSGANAVLCADDTANANAGSKIQSFQCLSDLADYWVQTRARQLVHNGDCMAAFGGNVFLATCTAGDPSQQWSQSTIGGELRNQGSNGCLTATSAKDGVQLVVGSCDSGADQTWHIPAMSV